MFVHILQNIEAESAGTIIDWLKLRTIEFEVINTFKGEPLPEVESVDAVINLGSPVSMSQYGEHEHLGKLYTFLEQIVKFDKRYLGICFGSQMLSHVLGGEVTQNQVKELGKFEVSLTEHGKSDALFRDFPDSFPVFHWHSDTFSLPRGCELLVEGVDCKNQAFRHGKQAGVQFHCEVDRVKVEHWCKTYQDELIEINKTTEEIIEAFVPTEQELLSLNYQLLDNFIKL